MSRKIFNPLPFSCPSCGSYMVYKASTFNLECINCKATKAIDAKSYDFSGKRELVEVTISSEIRVVDCFGCGADIEFERFTLSQKCPYCKTPLVTKPLNSPSPNALIPFSITEKDARSIFKNWLGSLWFAPNELKKLLDFDHQFLASYIPYFSFDASTHSHYSGYRGDAYYVTVNKRVIIDGREQIIQTQERRVRWTPVEGAVSREFRDVLVDAKKELPPPVKGLNFDTNLLVEFNPSFFSGYMGYEYNRTLSETLLDAKKYMKSVIYKDVIWDIGGDEQRVDFINTDYSQERFDIFLMPAFIGKFNYKNRDYSVIINGSSGEISGDRPYSYIKIFFAVASILLILATLLYLDENYGGYIETYFNNRPYLP
jgi:DNA-directed RNA polymerase subunit M/transcription elongation factor TFIIS